MDDFREVCDGMVMSLIVPTILGLFVGATLRCLYSWLLQWLGIAENSFPGLQNDVMGIKKTTIQVMDLMHVTSHGGVGGTTNVNVYYYHALAQAWMEMMKLFSQVQDDQRNFIDRLQATFEAKSEMLGQNMSISLEKEFMRNDESFTKLRQTTETLQEEILSMKAFLQTLVPKPFSDPSEEKKIKKSIALTDSFAQTEFEIKRKTKDENIKNGPNAEHEASRVISIVKKCLADLMKDTKLHLSIDREEESRELQVILTKLAEDREDIKKTILQAFSIAAEQARKNFDQCSHIGQDAMHYIAVLNENTNKMLKLKLEETDDRLNEILNAANRQIFDVNGIKGTLENIDGQFHEIFQRVELGCQKNTEHCEEMRQNLEETSNNWLGTVSEVENMAKHLYEDSCKMKDMLREVDTLVDDLKQKESGIGQENKEVIKEIMQYDSSISQEHVLAEKQNKMIFVYSLLHSNCEKMTNMNHKVENGCQTICKLIDGLEEKLRSLNASVEKLDGIIRNIDLEGLADGAYMQCDKNIEIGDQANIGNSGDGQLNMLRKLRSKLTKETLAHKIQNAIAIDKEVKMIEIILKKVYEKKNLNCQNDEMRLLSMDVDGLYTAEKGQLTQAIEREYFSRNLTKLEKNEEDGSECATEAERH